MTECFQKPRFRRDRRACRAGWLGGPRRGRIVNITALTVISDLAERLRPGRGDRVSRGRNTVEAYEGYDNRAGEQRLSAGNSEMPGGNLKLPRRMVRGEPAEGETGTARPARSVPYCGEIVTRAGRLPPCSGRGR